MVPGTTLNYFVCIADDEQVECSLVGTDQQLLISLITPSHVHQCLSVPGGHPVHLRSARNSSKYCPPRSLSSRNSRSPVSVLLSCISSFLREREDDIELQGRGVGVDHDKLGEYRCIRERPQGSVAEGWHANPASVPGGVPREYNPFVY